MAYEGVWNMADSGGIGTESGAPSRTVDAIQPWSVTDAPLGELVLRLTAGTLGVGLLGGLGAAFLCEFSFFYAPGKASGAVWLLVVGVHLALWGMAAWRVKTITQHKIPRIVGQLGVIGLIWTPVLVSFTNIRKSTAIWPLLLGSIAGLLAAFTALSLVLFAILVMRTLPVRINLLAGHILLTAAAVIASAVTTVLFSPQFLVTTTTVAVTGVALTARWCLLGSVTRH